MTYVGIDVSKTTFIVAYSSAKGGKTKSFKNTVNGIHEFIQTISAVEHHCVLEATGNYSALLVYLLSEAGITVSLENPLKIKNFTRVMLSVTKTDEIDARLIAMYGEKMQPAPYKKQIELLTSIKGIGVTLAAALIMATGGFTYFDNAKQLTRYLGLAPTYQQSGTSVNVKGHINRNGDSSLRSQLYVAAFASLRCNTECKECFDRLRSKGKPGKVALIAVANKLVRQAFAVVTQEKPYVDGFKSAKP